MGKTTLNVFGSQEVEKCLQNIHVESANNGFQEINSSPFANTVHDIISSFQNHVHRNDTDGQN